jgi:dCMP deaminase
MEVERVTVPIPIISTDVWDNRWLQLATQIGEWSKDRRHRVGCVIVGSANQVLSTGYNGFPRGVDDDIDERHERPAKYDWTEHAERNAVYNAARYGVRIEGSSMYSSLFPCISCSRAVIQSGITAVVTRSPDLSHHRWGDEFLFSQSLLGEAGVHVRLVDE